MKKILLLFCALALTACAKEEEEPSEGRMVELSLGTWRVDDVPELNAFLARFQEAYPSISVKLVATVPPEYNATTRLQLENGTAPDLLYARSFATGEQLFTDGYYMDITDMKDVLSSYSDGSRASWMSEGGQQFALPFVAVSHGIYYNKDILDDLGIGLPQTWEEFLASCESIKQAGIIPIANGLADEWDIAEVVFMSIAPNFIGGREGRLAYDDSERRFDGPEVVALFEAMGALAPYLPEGFEALGYNDSNALFATGQAAFYFDGSWSLDTFHDAPFQWDVLAPPPPMGTDSGYITFHPDAGIAINAATAYPEEAKTFLRWLVSDEGLQATIETLPAGFFPMAEKSLSLPDPRANSFLALNQGRETDVRWPWPRLLAGEPSGYDLMMQGSIRVITGEVSAQRAAKELQEGLAQWYQPAMEG